MEEGKYGEKYHEERTHEREERRREGGAIGEAKNMTEMEYKKKTLQKKGKTGERKPRKREENYGKEETRKKE